MDLVFKLFGMVAMIGMLVFGWMLVEKQKDKNPYSSKNRWNTERCESKTFDSMGKCMSDDEVSEATGEDALQ